MKAPTVECALNSQQGRQQLLRHLGLAARNNLLQVRRLFLEALRWGPCPVVNADEGTNGLQGSTTCFSNLAGLGIAAREQRSAGEVRGEL